MKQFKKKAINWAIVAILAFSGSVAFSQEITETPAEETITEVATETGDTGISLETSAVGDDVGLVIEDDSPGANFINNLGKLWYMTSTAGIVTVLTSLTKRVLPYRASFIALAYAGILWTVYFVAQSFGFAEQFDSLVKSITEIGFVVLGVTGTQVLSGWWYRANKTAEVPVIGFSKQSEQ